MVKWLSTIITNNIMGYSIKEGTKLFEFLYWTSKYNQVENFVSILTIIISIILIVLSIKKLSNIEKKLSE